MNLMAGAKNGWLTDAVFEAVWGTDKEVGGGIIIWTVIIGCIVWPIEIPWRCQSDNWDNAFLDGDSKHWCQFSLKDALLWVILDIAHAITPERIQSWPDRWIKKDDVCNF